MKILLRIFAGFFVLLGLACLVWYFRSAPRAGRLVWEAPVVKETFTAFADQADGNPAGEDGRNFLSRIVFQNKGTGPVRDFSISYQIPDYLSWTTPETHHEIQPGQTVVKLFYPKLPSKVTQIINHQTVTLETKIQWKDSLSSKPQEQVLRSNVELHGGNEVEHSGVPAVAAVVTPNVPVVKEAGAEVAKRTEESRSIDVDKIKDILAQRSASKTTLAEQPPPKREQNILPAPEEPPSTPPPPEQKNTEGPRPLQDGFYRYASQGHGITVDIPEKWVRVENGPIKGMIFTAQDMQTTLGVNVFCYAHLKSPDDAIKTVQQEFSSKAGVKLKISKRARKDEDGEAITYAGTATGAAGTNVWAGSFQMTREGVLGFVIGDNEKVHGRNTELMESITNSVSFGK